MTSKERMLRALNRQQPDRVPVTTHGWVGYHLRKYMDGIDPLEAYKQLGLDASMGGGACIETESPDWRPEIQEGTTARGFPFRRTIFHTPKGDLSETWEMEPTTAWISERMVKRPEDVDLIDRYMPIPRLDKASVAREYDRVGDAGILRGGVWGYQGGCWQHAAELYGLQDLILATHRDPAWVHHFLTVLNRKKLRYIEESLSGVKYDLIETGGGAASSTCISPKLHREFCVPYDRAQHDLLHSLGHKVAYHTCGGMMPILELIVENHCDASETLTPPGMGGDARAVEMKRRIGDKVCLIGGVNQREVLDMGTPESIRAEVLRLFREFGAGGGYIMSPSDHFFETPVENLRLYAQAARECVY
jgi:uroporphyrinogen decarboxylase